MYAGEWGEGILGVMLQTSHILETLVWWMLLMLSIQPIMWLTITWCVSKGCSNMLEWRLLVKQVFLKLQNNDNKIIFFFHDYFFLFSF